MEITSTTDKTVTLELGRIDYHYLGRKINKADVTIGFCLRPGNNETYFTSTGRVWNEKETENIHCSAGTPRFLFEGFFPNNATLKRIVNLADKWHLVPFSEIPENDLKEIVELMEEIEDFNGDLGNL